MAGDENARLAEILVRKARPHGAAKAHSSRNALDLRADCGEFIGRKIHHAVHGGRVECGAFAEDPGLEPGQHRFGVEGQVFDVHDVCPVWLRAEGAFRRSAP